MTKLGSLWSFVFVTLAASQLLANCGMDAAQTNKPVTAAPASGGTALTSPIGQPVVADHANGETTKMAMGTAVASADTAGEYRISPRDILQVTVFQVKDLESTVQVNEDGTITLPLVGKTQVSGRTTYEAEQAIAGKLREKYMQSPQVSIALKSYGKRITISGEVKGPRVLPDDGGTTLSQAIAGSGGVSDLADATRIHVARSKDQHVQDEIYNLDDIHAGKAADPLLKGGDIVVVEQSGTKVALKDVKDLLPFAFFASLI